jgi:proline iminopeptidase
VLHHVISVKLNGVDTARYTIPDPAIGKFPVLSLDEGWTPHPRYADPAFRMTFARIVSHYFQHHAWLADGQLLRDAHRLDGIPGVLIHGRLDLGSPTDVPWLLAHAWSGAELHLVGAGHAGGQDMLTHIMEATNRFAQQG